MDCCSDEHGHELKRVDVTLRSQVGDLFIVQKLGVSADDFNLILDWIDETCLVNNGDNLNIDPIVEKYRPREWVYFISPGVVADFRAAAIIGNDRSSLWADLVIM